MPRKAVFDRADFDANEMKDNQKKLQLEIEVKGYQIDSEGLVVSGEIGQCFSAQELVDKVLESIKSNDVFMDFLEGEAQSVSECAMPATNSSCVHLR